MKAKRSGLTIVEILVVVAIISLLVGLLLPAVNKVKSMAREAKQKVQFTALGLGLETFKNDYGDYPPSDNNSWIDDAGGSTGTPDTSGAQKLAEALLGYDLLGFHPDSGWRVDGTNRRSYSDGTTTHSPGSYYLYNRTIDREMDKRKGRYIDLDTANVARLGNNDGLFDLGAFAPFDSGADSFVICDVFGMGKNIVLNGKRQRAGVPVLYYRADTSEKVLERVYDRLDNDTLAFVKERMDRARKGEPVSLGNWNPLAGTGRDFYDQITDPRASTSNYKVPFKPDSYILISAGADGFYGTSDDIHNFQK